MNISSAGSRRSLGCGVANDSLVPATLDPNAGVGGVERTDAAILYRETAIVIKYRQCEVREVCASYIDFPILLEMSISQPWK